MEIKRKNNHEIYDSEIMCDGNTQEATLSCEDNAQGKTKRDTKNRDKKASVLNKISAAWSLITSLYAIVSTCIFIARGWVSGAVSYGLIGVLAVYVAVFIGLAVLTFRNPRGGAKSVKIYKKLLKIFKALATIVYLVITAISLAAITKVGSNEIVKWIVFVASFVMALVRLGLNIALLVIRIVRMRVARDFKVEVISFVDGNRVTKSVRNRLEERKYRDK